MTSFDKEDAKREQKYRRFMRFVLETCDNNASPFPKEPDDCYGEDPGEDHDAWMRDLRTREKDGEIEIEFEFV